MNKILEACQSLDRVVGDYLNDYEYDDGENCCHAPNETEHVLIHDAIAGLLADEKFVAAFVDWRLLVETGQTLADVKRVMANSEALARTVMLDQTGTA